MRLRPARRFTVDEYYRMAGAGILDEDDRVELIEGEIIELAAIGRHHQAGVDRLNSQFVSAIGRAGIVRIQGPVRLSATTEVQPDLSLLRYQADFYASDHPTAADVFLVVEVSETSARYDRRVKAPLYARHQIVEYWLIDLQAETLTVYRDPSNGAYQTIQTLRRGEQVAPGAFPLLSFQLDEILG